MKHLQKLNINLNRYIGLSLLFVGLFSTTDVWAQQVASSKPLTQKERRALQAEAQAKAKAQALVKTNESEIVMTIEELESLLTKIASQRKATLAARASIPTYSTTAIVARPTYLGTANPYINNGNNLAATSPEIVSLHRKVDQLLQQSNNGKNQYVTPVTGNTAPAIVNSIGRSVEGRDIMKASSIYFANNSVNLTAKEKQLITNLVPALQQHPDRGIIVLRGFASKLGNAYYNNQLSFNRANAIKEVLMQAGVKAEKIMILYHGADPATPDNQARRVDVSLELL